jgi:(p)ppGpp synthase/HD superfamily hydrolase
MEERNHLRLARAVTDAEYYHRGQLRKGTTIPYLSHPLAVCALVLESGGTEDEAIAALLHDAAEDVRIEGCSGEDVLTAINLNYGPVVAQIVRECSDALPMAGEEKPPYLQRKEAYVAHLRLVGPSTLLVSAADKLHNLRSILADWRAVGENVWERFSAPGDKRKTVLWYYQALYDVYTSSEVAADPRRARLTDEMRLILDTLTATRG